MCEGVRGGIPRLWEASQPSQLESPNYGFPELELYTVGCFSGAQMVLESYSYSDGSVPVAAPFLGLEAPGYPLKCWGMQQWPHSLCALSRGGPCRCYQGVSPVPLEEPPLLYLEPGVAGKSRTEPPGGVEW